MINKQIKEKSKVCRGCQDKYIEYEEVIRDIPGNFCTQRCYDKFVKLIKAETRPKCATCGGRFKPIDETDLICKKCKDFEKNCIITNCIICGSEVKTTSPEERFCSYECKKQYSRNWRNKRYQSNREGEECGNSSVGEQKLCDLISNVFFDQEVFFRKRYEWLRFVSILELDIYLPNINLAFEYDGIQHYKYIEYFHKDLEAFHDSQARDKFKDEKCKKMGITLIRVKDQEEYVNIPMLVRKLKEYGRSDLIMKYLDTYFFNGTDDCVL